MKTKMAFILFLSVFTGMNSPELCGQEKITEVVTYMENIAQSPPKKDAVSVQVNMQKDENGKIVMMRKYFIIKDCPSFVQRIIKAFDQEKEKAQTITEMLNSGNLYRKYIFKKDDKEVTSILNGTENRMTFSYTMNDPEIKTSESVFPGYEKMFFQGRTSSPRMARTGDPTTDAKATLDLLKTEGVSSEILLESYQTMLKTFKEDEYKTPYREALIKELEERIKSFNPEERFFRGESF